MVRRCSIILGTGLAILGLTGLNGPGPRSWMTWCDLVGAWTAFFIAGTIGPTSTRAQRIAGPVALGAGLLGACAIGYASGTVVHWLLWWTVAFAGAFLTLGISRYVRKEERVHPELAENSNDSLIVARRPAQ